MTGLLVISLSQVPTASGATGSPTEPLAPQSRQARELTASPRVAPVCTARKAVKFYAGRIAYWRSKMGAGSDDGLPVVVHSHPCPRYLAHVLQRKAHAAHKAFIRWYEHEWAWWKWLPDKFARVGACETGYGRKPGNWNWDSGTYVSAFGIYRPAYEQYAHWDAVNTPREQYEVAAAIQRRFGWSAWGCGGA